MEGCPSDCGQAGLGGGLTSEWTLQREGGQQLARGGEGPVVRPSLVSSKNRRKVSVAVGPWWTWAGPAYVGFYETQSHRGSCGAREQERA